MFRIFFNLDQKISINNQQLILPPGHLLSIYNFLYPKYDKFITHLAKNLNNNESIIDIGANVGDTLLRLIQPNLKLNYFSIEADDYFFKYLKRNTEKYSTNPKSKITIIKELVGLNLIGNLSKTTTGTKTLIRSNLGKKSKTLDSIILKNNIKNIALIKVDVDGYDYNVLLSGMKNIIKYKPKLFFEYMSLNKNKYFHLLKRLNKIGYKNWTALDNYGKIIFKNKIIIDIYCHC
jgi:FkbM family methyltransferase